MTTVLEAPGSRLELQFPNVSYGKASASSVVAAWPGLQPSLFTGRGPLLAFGPAATATLAASRIAGLRLEALSHQFAAVLSCPVQAQTVQFPMQ